VISSSEFNKLVEHNFISSHAAEELSRLTDQYSRNYNLKSKLERLITGIQKYQLDHPLGIDTNDLYIEGGMFSMKHNKFTFSGDPIVEYTLEELEFYYKLVHLLTHMAT